MEYLDLSSVYHNTLTRVGHKLRETKCAAGI